MGPAEHKRSARFLERVDRSGECWLWTGPTFSDHYGAATGLDGKTARAHRVAWEIEHGPIPEGMCVCHTCDVRACVRPSHLWLGTNDENMADMVEKGRAPHVANPHFGAANGMAQHPERSHFAKIKFASPGEKNPAAKLTQAQAQDIRERYRFRRTTLSQLAAEFGVGTSTIHRVVRGLTWASA